VDNFQVARDSGVKLSAVICPKSRPFVQVKVAHWKLVNTSAFIITKGFESICSLWSGHI